MLDCFLGFYPFIAHHHLYLLVTDKMASSSSATTSAPNPYRLNAQVYKSRLTENASRLFSTDAVRVIHCDGSYSE